MHFILLSHLLGELWALGIKYSINARGTFVVSRACIPHLRKAANPHVLALAPPLDLRPEWFAAHPAYTVAKYGMSLYMLAMATEFAADGIAFNALWPRTTIATSAVSLALTGTEGLRRSRTTAIVADAAYAIFNRSSRSCTGQFFIDDEVLAEEGVRDFTSYSVDPAANLAADLFVDPAAPAPAGVRVS